MEARDIPCPRCGQPPGMPCITPQGNAAKADHQARRREAEIDNFNARMAIAVEEDRKRLKRVPKHQYKVRNPHYVWCDVHGDIHTSDGDPYGDQPDYCKPDNWRRVYVGTDDRNEQF